MNSFTQHIPGVISGVEPEISDFSSIEDLYKISCVKRYMEIPNFTRLSVTNNGKNLMAEYNNGKKWWCLGYFKNPFFGFPEWKPIIDKG